MCAWKVKKNSFDEKRLTTVFFGSDTFVNRQSTFKWHSNHILKIIHTTLYVKITTNASTSTGFPRISSEKIPGHLKNSKLCIFFDIRTSIDVGINSFVLYNTYISHKYKAINHVSVHDIIIRR